MTVQMDDRKYIYGADQLAELEPAYAVTVHKSQGSEFPAVIMPVADVPARLCYRNLLYTGVTRARRLCILAGTRRTEQAMVDNVRQNMRYSGLRYLLREAVTPAENADETEKTHISGLAGPWANGSGTATGPCLSAALPAVRHGT